MTVYRLFAATLAGTSMEGVSTALERVTRRSVDRSTREIHAPGTKTYNRDRVVRVADWAWPYVEEAIDGLLPSARLFAHIPDRWRARMEHDRARLALIEQRHDVYSVAPDGTPHEYTMRDHRHTWAVRAVRSGWPIDAIARQMGHIDGTLIMKVYGRFLPQQGERDRWEAMATARDAERKELNAETSAV